MGCIFLGGERVLAQELGELVGRAFNWLGKGKGTKPGSPGKGNGLECLNLRKGALLGSLNLLHQVLVPLHHTRNVSALMHPAGGTSEELEALAQRSGISETWCEFSL